MYSLMVVLSLLTSAAFLHVYVYRNRRYLPLFAVLVAAILYTHTWGIFVTAGPDRLADPAAAWPPRTGGRSSRTC